MAAALSTGTATVVLGDVAGSTRRWQQQPGAISQSSHRLAARLGELTAAHADAVDRVLRAAGIEYAATSPGSRPVALTPAELDVVVAVDP